MHAWMHAHTGFTAAASSCSDNAGDAQPYSAKTYKQKQYTSKCAYYKERNYCSRSSFQSRCAKTCTGIGSDESAYSKPFETRASEEKAFTSKCAYYKQRRSCSRSSYKSRCAKTCTGVGSDENAYSKPYTRWVYIETEKKYSSKCAYFKDRGLCSLSEYAEKCQRTCGRCTASDKTLSPSKGPPLPPSKLNCNSKTAASVTRPQRDSAFFLQSYLLKIMIY